MELFRPSCTSPHSVAETLTRLEEMIRARGLKLFAQIDHSGEAEQVGLKIQPAQVLTFGGPKAGTPLMIAPPATRARFAPQGADLAR